MKTLCPKPTELVILLLGLVFALVIRKIRSGEGKTKYVLGSVGEREVKVNKKETKAELKQPTPTCFRKPRELATRLTLSLSNASRNPNTSLHATHNFHVTKYNSPSSLN